MRIAVRIGIALLALVALALAALALALPSIIEGAELRTRFDRLARDTIGRRLDYGAVSIGLLPPRLEVSDLVIGGVSDESPPALEAGSAALALAWRPLFSGRAVVDALVIDSAALRMVRTAEGIDLLVAGIPAAPAAPSPPEASGASPISLRRVTLRSSRIVFDDRVATPPFTWRLDDVRLDATGEGLDDPVDFALDARIESGGALNGKGRFDPAGATRAELELEGFVLDPLRSYLAALDSIGGSSSARVAVARAADGAVDLAVTARSDDLDVAAGDARALGPVDLKATLELRDGAVEGPYTVDLTRAKLDLADGAVRKAAGEPATLEGRVRIDENGTGSDFHLQLRNLGAKASLRTEPALRIELSAPAFALAGWEKTIPALSDYAPRGELAIGRLDYTSEPQRLLGNVELRKVRIEQGEGAPPIEVSGFVDAQGRALSVRDMLATAGPARFRVRGGVEDLFGSRNATLRLDNPEPIESNTVFSLVDALRDAIYGALALDLDLGLPLAGPAAELPALERLRGSFSFRIGGDEAGGRLRGVSLLRQVFDRFGALGYAALLALPARKGKSLEQYYSEKFRVAAGSFRVADGRAVTDDLRIVHERYRANLRGGLRLTDLALDMRGDVVIGPELDAALSGAETGRERTIPLARVGGTVTAPTVALRDEDAARFAAQYALGEDSKLGRKIDKALGAGASDLLRDVLGSGKN